MTNSTTEPLRIEVWAAMAEHFLDTETRQEIPLTALCCVRARLSTLEARDVWRYEVSPALAFNVWDVAGEWAGWDRDWLVHRIESARRSPLNRPGICGWFAYRCRVHFMDAFFRSIARCLDELWALPSDQEREQRARDLAFLANHYFDFCPQELRALPETDRHRIRAIDLTSFVRLMAPATSSDDRAAAELRLCAAVDGGSFP